MLIIKIILLILAVILFISMWILLAPLVLKIDTQGGIYYLKLDSILKLQLFLKSESVSLRVTLFFYSFSIDPWKFLKSKDKQKKKKKKKKKKPGKIKMGSSVSAGRKLIREIIRSFSVKKFELELDTGNVITNAYLYPVGVVTGSRINMSVNNHGRNRANLEIQNRLIKLLIIFVRFYIRSK